MIRLLRKGLPINVVNAYLSISSLCDLAEALHQETSIEIDRYFCIYCIIHIDTLSIIYSSLLSILDIYSLGSPATTLKT